VVLPVGGYEGTPGVDKDSYNLDRDTLKDQQRDVSRRGHSFSEASVSPRVNCPRCGEGLLPAAGGRGEVTPVDVGDANVDVVGRREHRRSKHLRSHAHGENLAGAKDQGM
jgi:hypothetical protein